MQLGEIPWKGHEKTSHQAQTSDLLSWQPLHTTSPLTHQPIYPHQHQENEFIDRL